MAGKKAKETVEDQAEAPEAEVQEPQAVAPAEAADSTGDDSQSVETLLVSTPEPGPSLESRCLEAKQLLDGMSAGQDPHPVGRCAEDLILGFVTPELAASYRAAKLRVGF